MVRQRFLVPPYLGSNPSAPANLPQSAVSGHRQRDGDGEAPALGAVVDVDTGAEGAGDFGHDVQTKAAGAGAHFGRSRIGLPYLCSPICRKGVPQNAPKNAPTITLGQDGSVVSALPNPSLLIDSRAT